MDLFDHGSARNAIAYRKYFTNDRILSGFLAENYDAVVLIQKSTKLPVADLRSCAGAEMHASAQVLDNRGKVELYVEQLLPAERKSVETIAIVPNLQNYRVPLKLAPDVQGISVKIRLTGLGEVILRELSLSCAHSPTVVVPIATSQWTTSGSVDLYNWNITPCGASSCATLKSKPLDDHFAAERDLVTVDLGSGLQLRMPVAVWTDGRRTVAESTVPPARRDFAAGDLAVRLGAVAAIWGTLGTFYPYFHDQQVDWASVLPVAFQEAAHTTLPDDFQTALSHLVAHLPDSHGRVTHPYTQTRGILPIAFRRIGSKLFVYSRVQEYAPQVPVGSEVVELRGTGAMQELQRSSHLVAAATENARKFSSEFRPRLGDLGSFARIRIRTVDGRESDALLPYVSRDLYNLGIPYERPKSGTEVAQGVFYLDFDSLTEGQWNSLLPTLQGARALIWDFRGYTGDIAFTAVAHLIEREVLEPLFQLPKHAPLGNRSFYDSQTALRPAAPHLTAAVIALIDGQSASAVETIVQMLRDYKLAFLVGETSAGTNGNTDTFEVPGGFEVRFTAWRVASPDGTTIHGHGIVPDQIVRPTEDGLRAGRDEVLEAGIAAAKQRMARE